MTAKKKTTNRKGKAAAKTTPVAEEKAKKDLRDDVAGVLLNLCGLLALLALITFDQEGTNLVGRVGHFMADSVLFVLGLASFALAGVLLIWGTALILGRHLFDEVREVLGWTLALAVAPPIFQMLFDAPVLGHPAGGLVGGIVAGLMIAALAPFGAALCCVAVLLVAAMLITGRSVKELFRGWSERMATSREQRAARRAAKAEAKLAAKTAAEEAREAKAKAKVDAEPAPIEEAPEAEAEPSVEAAEDDEVISRRQGLLSRLVTRARTRVSPDDTTPDVGDAEVDDEPAWAMALDDDDAFDDVTSEELAAAPPARAAKPTPPPAPAAAPKPATAADAKSPADVDQQASGSAKRTPAATLNAPAAIGAPTPAEEAPDIGPIIVESAAQKERKRAEDLDRAQQVALPLNDGKNTWQLPPLSFLEYDESESEVDREALRDLAQRLESALADFKVKGRVSGICPGPVVTLFEFEPESGTKLSRISGLSDDIAMALRAHKVRIIAPIPGKGCVGIEVPNDSRETVYLKEILAADVFIKAKSNLTMALGKDIEGYPVCMDLAKSPHLLVAGTTGSGKSVSVNAMITSVLYNASPDDVKMILIDPKQLEFAIYENMPHLLLPVVTDPSKAATALNWAVQEMERRYKLMAELKVRNLKGYNDKLAKLHAELAEAGPVGEDHVPSPTEVMLTRTDADDRVSHRRMFQLVVVVDEFADLMMVAGKEVEVAVARLAQKARAAGIHCILATQRPSVDVITGLIKANFPTRISFRLMSGTDSRTVLDTVGSENLLGMGDMLYRPPGTSELRRVHGAFVDESEIEKIVDFLSEQRMPDFDESILAAPEADGSESDEPVDELYDQACSVVIEAGYASISMVQRKLRIGYNRAARIVEEMERQQLIGPASGGSSRREVLVGGASAQL